MDELEIDLVKVSFEEGRELWVQKKFVSVSQIQPYRSRGDEFAEEMENPEGPVFNVSFVEAAAFCNYLSELNGFSPAYDIAKDPVNPDNLDTEGFRLLTLEEWENLLSMEEELEKSGIVCLRGCFWQLTETEKSLPFKPDGRADFENPEFIWSYRIAVGGSSDSSKALVEGKPLALILAFEGDYRTAFRVVRGNYSQNKVTRYFDQK